MTYKEDGKERSVFDDTVIVFTSTNGARTPEVENWKKASAKNFQSPGKKKLCMFQSPGSGGGSNKPLRGGQGDLLEGGTRIPAFVSNLDKVFQKMTKMSVFRLFKIHEQESRWKSSLKKCSYALVQVSFFIYRCLGR